MSLFSNIEHLTAASGIEAVSVDSPNQPRVYRGPESWRKILDAAFSVFQRAAEPSIRLVVGPHTIVLQREGEEIVAVLLPTGHAVAKSLRRMIRRMARKDRGPLPKPISPAMTPATPSASPSASAGDSPLRF